MFVQGSYDTGEVRDGHKLVRNEHPDDGIDLIHPESCKVGDERHGGIVMIQHHSCPWAREMDWHDSVLDLHVDGPETALEALPVDKEVEVVWQFRSWSGWTDYGWEGDGEFSWWVDSLTSDEERQS